MNKEQRDKITIIAILMAGASALSAYIIYTAFRFAGGDVSTSRGKGRALEAIGEMFGPTGSLIFAALVLGGLTFWLVRTVRRFRSEAHQGVARG